MSHIIRCDGPGCATTGPDLTVPDGWTTLVHRGAPVRHFCGWTCVQAYTGQQRDRSWQDSVRATQGRCLDCGHLIPLDRAHVCTGSWSRRGVGPFHE